METIDSHLRNPVWLHTWVLTFRFDHSARGITFSQADAVISRGMNLIGPEISRLERCPV
jgi:hypothetical protein